MSGLTVDLAVLGPRVGAACDKLLAERDSGLMHDSSAYLGFLVRALPGTVVHYLLARDGSRLLGFLPLAQCRSADGRLVVNSLPFFGSHGGPCVAADAPLPTVQRALLASAIDHARSYGAAALTLVENPLAPVAEAALEGLELAVVDERIGQISHLPDPAGDIQAELFAAMHVKTRNAVRKGAAQGMHVQTRTDEVAMAWLQATHEASILALGGVPKSLDTMRALTAAFPLGSGSLLYVGMFGEEIAVAMLLVLYHDKVEYFTPAVAPEHRDRQLLSALIQHAMGELALRGFRIWNWGGTWLNQPGVHRFKQRWGARDLRYRYFNQVWDPSLREAPHTRLARDFPGYYVLRYAS